MPPRIPGTQLARARAMRSGQTHAEDIMWRALRNRQLGVKFRRQVPIGGYIADFACLEAKLVVEVDGPSHETDEGRAHDTRRDLWFAEQGWRIARVPNELVTGGGDLALARIKALLNQSK